MKNWINNKIAELQMAAVAEDEGQGTVEYAAVLGIIVIGVVLLFQLAPVGTAINTLINNITDAAGL